jgi:crotonyl-CoA carboxylase/reductase
MLMGWSPNVVETGDVVLVWGAAGGLGSMALQITAAEGGRPVAVSSDEAKRLFCMDHGAVGVVNRNDFTHWGKMPDTESKEYGEWAKGARAFGKAIWDACGERVSPRIVFEHPGEATLPTSGFVAATGGMVVICAGTTGYNITMDLRYHWMRQKRLQGSHLSISVPSLIGTGSRMIGISALPMSPLKTRRRFRPLSWSSMSRMTWALPSM